MKHVAYLFLKRLTDIVFSLLGLIVTSPILLPVMFLVWKQDKHSPFYVAERVGKDFKPFKMVKLRSMIKNADTSGVDSTSVNDMRITPIGQFIRKYKLDELAQLWNVLLGDMSLVGPRPNLFNQEELIVERDTRGVYNVRPGITGLAQINKIDMSTPQFLAETDAKMINHLNVWYYFKYIFLTVFGKGFGDRIKQT